MVFSSLPVLSSGALAPCLFSVVTCRAQTSVPANLWFCYTARFQSANHAAQLLEVYTGCAFLLYVQTCIGFTASPRAVDERMCMLAGIFSTTSSLEYLSKGVGVVDVAGGGVIHCLAGTVTLVLLYCSKLARKNVGDNMQQEQLSAILVSIGTILLWPAFMMLHVAVTADWKQSEMLWVDETVCSPRRVVPNQTFEACKVLNAASVCMRWLDFKTVAHACQDRRWRNSPDACVPSINNQFGNSFNHKCGWMPALDAAGGNSNTVERCKWMHCYYAVQAQAGLQCSAHNLAWDPCSHRCIRSIMHCGTPVDTHPHRSSGQCLMRLAASAAAEARHA